MVNMANPIPPIAPKIFISHAWEDKALVRRLEAELKAAGAETWVDHSGVHGGDNLPKRISDALTWCDTVLLVWSEAASKSHWVELEWTNALSLRKTIIPCRVDQTPLPALLANVLYVDCRDFAKGFTQLQQALHLDPSATKPEPPPSSTTKDRRIDAAIPSIAEVGRPIDLRVQVRFPDSPRFGLEDWPVKTKPAQLEQAAENVTLEFPVDAATGKLGAARLEIRIVAPEFDIAGNASQILLVPPDALSKYLSFLMTSKRAGVCRLNVEVYNLEHIFLGAIPIETEVGSEVKSPSTNVANLFLFVTVGQEKPVTRSGGTYSKSKEITQRTPAPSQTVTSSDGQIIQAGRDVIITQPKSEANEKKGIGKSLALWLGIVATVVTIITSIVQLVPDSGAPKSSRFFGEVKYKGTDKGVEGAEIMVQAQMNGPIVGQNKTGARGAFDFAIKAKWEETVWVTVSLGDSIGFEGSLTLAGNQDIPFEPIKKKP